MTPVQVLIGDGLTAGAEYMLRTTGEYRTVEAVLLQLPFEIGAVGVLAVIAASFLRAGTDLPAWRRPTLIVAIMWVQCLFFLPINNQSAVIALALGAMSVRPRESGAVA